MVSRRTAAGLALALLVLAASVTGTASAQDYSFRLDRSIVDAYWESDGTLRLEYIMVFSNDSFAPPIEFVDIGLPTSAYDLGRIAATVDGLAVPHIARSPYVDPGVELGLGAGAIRPGASGTVRVSIAGVREVLYAADDAGYASALFSPTWFDARYVSGSTDMTVTFHLPPGVQPEEPRWFASPPGWPEAPTTGFDSEGRIVYQWRNPSANGHTRYAFGAAFPDRVVPASAVQQPTIFQRLGLSTELAIGALCFVGFGLFMAFWIVLSIQLDRRRKLAYLPPKIAIEGHGIKRGLTAVEAAVLLETPLDRVLTMMLFGLVRKNSARVVSEQPLRIEKVEPAPAELRDYEAAFLTAALTTAARERQAALQKVTVDLVKAVQAKMKGFSLRETRDYYRAIVRKAWAQVEQAGTPEVKSERFEQELEWTMLDRDFERRTRRTFETGPVYVPVWWGNYRPTSVRPGGVLAAPAPAAPAGRGGMPTLPGSSFAASLVTGIQNTAGGLVSNLTGFTSGVTRTTNPPPPPSARPSGGGWSSGGGGGGGCACACACACAGCACACAGGGR